LLPLTVPLLQSPHGRYVDVALRFSRKVIGSFMPLLQQAPDAHEALARGGIGVDLVGEERAARAGVTRAALLGVKSQLLALAAGGGELAPRARELVGLIDQL
jgi:katanin p80 WD40 repeat-containing subunit B1